ncbi:MAG: FkbM family methyltransferase [Ignavibacteria bacterium]|nr:FkbM family methyltransferase [Ignavibacteria bacterium]
MKKTIYWLLGKYGLELRKKYNGFSINNKLDWFAHKDFKTILDVGANDGQFALFIMKLFPNSKIFSFEPLTSCYKNILDLSKNEKRIIAFNCALGEKNESTEIYHNEFSPSSSLLKMGKEHIKNFPYTEAQKKETVSVRMLDSIEELSGVGGEVLMKVDVQGYELNVIKGGKEFIRKYSPYIILEVSFADLYENEPPFDELYGTMKELGYCFKGVLDQMYSTLDGKILQADVLFEKMI